MFLHRPVRISAAWFLPSSMLCGRRCFWSAGRGEKQNWPTGGALWTPLPSPWRNPGRSSGWGLLPYPELAQMKFWQNSFISAYRSPHVKRGGLMQSLSTCTTLQPLDWQTIPGNVVGLQQERVFRTTRGLWGGSVGGRLWGCLLLCGMNRGLEWGAVGDPFEKACGGLV